MSFDGTAWLRATAADVAEHDSWLSPAERSVLAGLRVATRRRDWRLGRWVAKLAVGMVLGRDESCIEIVAAPDGAPEALLDGLRAPVAISISHRAGLAACLVAPAGAPAGCDLELIEPRAEAFARAYFNGDELALIERRPANERDLLVTLVWSAKESALKALRQGLRLDTREVEVSLALDDEPESSHDIPCGLMPGDEAGFVGSADLDWRPLRVSCRRRMLEGWWRTEGRHVLTAITEPAARPPLKLR